MFRRIILAGLSIAIACAAVTTPAQAATAPPTDAAAAPLTTQQIQEKITQENVTLLPQLRAAGGRQVGNQMVMPNGSQVSVTPQAYSDCPSGWVCLWDQVGYAGRMLKWSSPGTRESMGNYGFNDQMSSWANKTGSLDAKWFYDGIESGISRCMNPGTSSSNVGTGDNDKMSGLSIYTNNNAC